MLFAKCMVNLVNTGQHINLAPTRRLGPTGRQLQALSHTHQPPMTKKHEYLGILYAALGSLTFGYALSTGSTIIGLSGFVDYYNIDTFGPDPAYANQIQGGEPRFINHIQS